MRCMTNRTAMGALVSLLLCPSVAEGMPIAGGELRVRRTESAADCPDEQALGASTLALGARRSEVSSGELDVEVVLDRDETSYVARIRVTGRKSGEREIRSPGERCESLAEATSVALAILFDLLPKEPEPPDPPALPLATPPPPPPVEPRRDVAPPAIEPARQLGPIPIARVGTYAGLASGLLGPGLSGQVGAGFRAPVMRSLELGAGGFWAPGRDFAHGPGTVSVSLVAGRADVTFRLLGNERIELAARLGVSTGAIVGSGTGYDDEDTAVEFWLAPCLGAAGRWDFTSRWALALSTTLLVPYRTQTFSVNGVAGKAFEGAPAAVLVELGPELAFF